MPLGTAGATRACEQDLPPASVVETRGAAAGDATNAAEACAAGPADTGPVNSAEGADHESQHLDAHVRGGDELPETEFLRQLGQVQPQKRLPIMKPDIVFFGEDLPPRFYRRLRWCYVIMDDAAFLRLRIDAYCLHCFGP